MKITKIENAHTPMTVEEYKNYGIVFNTVTDEMLTDIAKYEPEIKRGNQSFGKSQSQFMRNLMTFDSHTPIRNLRQILAEVEKKKLALSEANYNHAKKLLKIEKLQDSDKPRDRIELANLYTQVANSTLYIEGAIKEIHAMESAYKEIKEAHDIDNWNEEDFEREEEEYHIKKAFTQGIGDLMTGALSQGNNIYFRQIGINPVVASMEIKNYIRAVEQATMNGQIVDMNTQYDFLNAMYNKYKGCSQVVAKHNKISGTYYDKSVFKQLRNADD